MGEDEIAQDRDHERVRAAFGEEFVDPKLKSAVQRELRVKDFVLGEDQKKQADADAKDGESAGVLEFVAAGHG